MALWLAEGRLTWVGLGGAVPLSCGSGHLGLPRLQAEFNLSRMGSLLGPR